MNDTNLLDRDDIRELVRRKYGEAALHVMTSGTAACCGSGEEPCCGGNEPKSEGCCTNTVDPITSNLYSDTEASEVPEAAILASLGCGNPTALTELREGEIVLDLGSGGGIDVLLSAKRVGPTGFAYGLDMTDGMLALAEKNRQEAGASNVTFLKGHIEQIPLPDESIDVIISNCVINLSADKSQVLKEAFRVLRPGGRFAVSDVVVDGPLPDAVRRDMEMYVGCVAGALDRDEYRQGLEKAGFADIDIEPTRRYRFSDLEGTWSEHGIGSLTPNERQALDGKIMSAFIRAVKPA
ncbi:MAG: Arsenite methyltransferase [Fimbriimonadaceae bacterium]|nr:Arsenite methyltransferase [Fimbriimonadaceae bacterium]